MNFANWHAHANGADRVSPPMPPVSASSDFTRDVSEAMIQETLELRFETGHRSFKCRSGRHLGSRYVIDPEEAAEVKGGEYSNSCQRSTRLVAQFASRRLQGEWSHCLRALKHEATTQQPAMLMNGSTNWVFEACIPTTEATMIGPMTRLMNNRFSPSWKAAAE